MRGREIKVREEKEGKELERRNRVEKGQVGNVDS